MRWFVTGADSKTGNDVTLTFEAATREEAETIATYNGIFVSHIEPVDPKELSPTLSEDPLVRDAPGKYHVVGTDWATGLRTSWYVTAANRTAARTVAEGEGIVITKLEYIGPE